ncbi:MAG: hypothetical protein JWL90_3150 [Chthoniobacteraceae bacterium]|jgi:hypothetical protein|nr:hypothetical protein [Chthoniobacteraceae bacterium]
MDTAENLSIFFNAVADHAAAAAWAGRRQRVDCTFKTIEGVAFPADNYFEGFIVFVSADFTFSHIVLFKRFVREVW